MTVDFESGRLLLEVTGIDGQITKASKKIAQVLYATQTQRAGDRVALVVNAYRQKSIDEREKLEVVTEDAGWLLEGLKAVVLTTTDLYRVWLMSLSDKASARAALERLRVAPAGVFQLTARDGS